MSSVCYSLKFLRTLRIKLNIVLSVSAATMSRGHIVSVGKYICMEV